MLLESDLNKLGQLKVSTLIKYLSGGLVTLFLLKFCFRNRGTVDILEELSQPAPDHIKQRISQYLKSSNQSWERSQCNAYENWRHCLEQILKDFQVR